MSLYTQLLKKRKDGKHQIALLIDPDKLDEKETFQMVKRAVKSEVDYFFVGGSLLTNNYFEKCIRTIKENCSIPVLIFPGNGLQISNKADGILFLSLISGRNPEMLIGRHVITAPFLKISNLEVLATGYMLIESGTPTTVSYMSNTTPIPHDKNDVAMCTALAGEFLGLKTIFMDAGSGAKNPVSASMIEAVRSTIQIPLIVGGGIRTPQKAIENCKAGADVIVVGNAFEKNPNLIASISDAVHSV